jgi:hypothetical protein
MPEETTAKVIAMLITEPVLFIIVRVPAAIPRRSTGTAPMIVLVLGELNTPEPIPITTCHTMIRRREVSALIQVNPRSPIAERASPIVLKTREPYLSDSTPLTGELTIIARANGVRYSPAGDPVEEIGGVGEGEKPRLEEAQIEQGLLHPNLESNEQREEHDGTGDSSDYHG